MDARVLTNLLSSSQLATRGGNPANVVDALFHIGTQLKYLGGGDNGDQRGAIEVLAVSVQEAGEAIERGLCEIANAIREGK